MESQHMTQQVFADFLQQSPATLSSIFNHRTRPTLNIVDAIKAKIPNISIEWLLYGTGEMFSQPMESAQAAISGNNGERQDMLLPFEEGDMGQSTPQILFMVHHRVLCTVGMRCLRRLACRLFCRV